MRRKEQDKMNMRIFVPLVICCAVVNIVQSFPSTVDAVRYVDKDYGNLDGHQLAGWLARQLRQRGYISTIQLPVFPYRLPLEAKRNSEVTNAIIGSEETQKMYRDGR
ncbi:hypothetical protein NQ317_004224 [Molorchus minor]|uniref:Uncharacterized protein n=1 Tax=Molorchus minor TaxID=1323400 RepID=A0ABQ9JKH6_9CUCU|nr:hypothetical protein NQ317_004224 [Molorchus minor]